MDEEPAQINGKEDAKENQQETVELPAASSTTESLPQGSVDPVLESQENQSALIQEDSAKDIEPGEALPEVTQAEEQQTPVFSHEQPDPDLSLSPNSQPLSQPSQSFEMVEPPAEEADPDLSLSHSSPLPDPPAEQSESASPPFTTEHSASDLPNQHQEDADLNLSAGEPLRESPEVKEKEPEVETKQDAKDDQADEDLKLAAADSLPEPPSQSPQTASSPFTTEHSASEFDNTQQADADLQLSHGAPLRESPAVAPRDEEQDSEDAQADSDLISSAPSPLPYTPSKQMDDASSPFTTEHSSSLPDPTDSQQEADADLQLSSGAPLRESPAVGARDEEQESEDAQADSDLKLAAPSALPEVPSRPESTSASLFTTETEAHEVKEQQADADLQLASGEPLKGKMDGQSSVEEEQADPVLSLSKASDLPDPPIKPQDSSSPFTTTIPSSEGLQPDLEQADPDLSLSSGSALPEPPLETIPEDKPASFEQPAYSEVLASRRTSEGSVMSTVTEDLAAMSGASVGTDDPALCVLTEPISPIAAPTEPTAKLMDESDRAESSSAFKAPFNFPKTPRDDKSDFPDFEELPRRGNKPSGPEPDAPSLTMSIFNNFGSQNVPWRRRILTVVASLGINLFLPFVNGVMLGVLPL